MNEVDYIQPYETDSFTSSISLSVIVPNNETNIINKLLSEKIENLSKNIPTNFNTNFISTLTTNSKYEIINLLELMEKLTKENKELKSDIQTFYKFKLIKKKYKKSHKKCCTLL